MDPFSALSVAAAVVQFVDFGTNIVSKGSKLYKSTEGALIENIELEKASTRLQGLSSTVQTFLRGDYQGPQSGPLVECDQALHTICEACLEVSKELIDKLDKLKVPDGHPHKKWKSIQQAFKTVYSKDKIEEILGRLVGLRNELNTNVLVSLK